MSRLKIGMGFHTSANCHCNGIGEYLSLLAQGGNTIAAKSVDSTSSLMDFQKEIQTGADGYAVYRYSKEGDVPPYGAPVDVVANNYLNMVNESWPPELDESLFYVEVMNEVDQNHSDWLGELLCKTATLFLEHGYNFCGPGWGPGQPEPHNWRTPGMLKFLELCSQYPESLAISLHEYAYDNDMADMIPYQMGRVIDMNAACYENGIHPPNVFVTEFGWSYQTAPDYQQGVPQITRMLDWYIEHTPNVKALFLWALDKDEKWARIADTINPYMTPLLNSISSREWDPPKEPDPPPTTRPKIVILKLAQTHNESAWGLAAQYAYDNYKRTITASHDDMLSMLRSGNTQSYALIADPDRASQVESIALLDKEGLKHSVIYIEDRPPPPRLDILEFRPCTTERITQYFAANPNYYRQFGLPGHEGVDFGVGYGLPYYAAQSGVVVWASNLTGDGNLSNYGWHVYIRHDVEGIQFHTLYAHAQQNLPVAPGDIVEAGHTVGYSGNSGNSTEAHLHFGVLWPTDTGNGYPMWPLGQPVDPLPYVEDKPSPPINEKFFNLLDYMAGDGRLYEVKNADGGQERFQTQWVSDNQFWQTKNDNAEQLFLLPGFISRGWDTSPGDGRYYQQQNPKGNSSAVWLPDFMRQGETFQTSLWVQFFNWDCTKSMFNSGSVTDTRRFVEWHEVWTSRAGITLNDVIEIHWVNGGETYFYARDFGLVGWERTHQDPHTPKWSAISEIHEPGQRPDNEVLLPACLRQAIKRLQME